MSLSSQDVNVVNTPDVSVSNFPATQPVSGTVSVGNFPATQPVSGTVSVGNFPSTQNVAVTNTVMVQTAVASTATLTQVVLTNNTNATLLAANANRKSAIIYAPQQPLQIKYGATASATSFTYKLTSTNTTLVVTGWTGQIDAFGQAGTVNVTELV